MRKRRRHLNPEIKEWAQAIGMWIPFIAMIIYGIFTKIGF